MSLHMWSVHSWKTKLLQSKPAPVETIFFLRVKAFVRVSVLGNTAGHEMVESLTVADGHTEKK